MLDFVQLSLRENLFWLEVMADHALFIQAALPHEARDLIDEAAAFHRSFSDWRVKVAELQNPELDQVKEVNRDSITLVNDLIDYKTRVLELRLSGELGGYNYPLFLVHARREAQRFARKLEQLNEAYRPVRLKLAEFVAIDENFWTLTMSEHARFMSHALDPSMENLVLRCNRLARQFERLNMEAREIGDHLNAVGPIGVIRYSRNLVRPGVQMRDFKAATLQGIEKGDIIGNITSRLADHLLREAIKYLEDLNDHVADLQASRIM